MTPLQQLAAAIDAGTMDFSDTVVETIGETGWNAYNGSLDAAKALHDAMGLDRWELWRVVDFEGAVAYGCNLPGIDTVYNEIAARAWLLAIIRVLIAQETKE